MARSRKTHKSWKLPLSIETLEKLAIKMMPELSKGMVTPDHRFCRTSGIWRKANGTLTCRFAYRTEKGNSIVHTLHNVPDPRTWATAADE